MIVLYIPYLYTWLYNISYLWYVLHAVIVLFSLLLRMALQYLLSLVSIVCFDSAIFLIFTNGFNKSLVCIVCSDSVMYVTFTNGCTIAHFFGMHCLL